MDRRSVIAGIASVPLLALPHVLTTAHAQAPAPTVTTVTVAKSPSCGCCGAWVEHMREAGFAVEVHEMEGDALEALKRRAGLAPDQMSCHTASVEGYVVEGHVPAEDVRRLLAERPEALGLAVPGMPVGSPGMEMGERRDPFDTLLIGPDGAATVFASH